MVFSDVFSCKMIKKDQENFPAHARGVVRHWEEQKKMQKEKSGKLEKLGRFEEVGLLFDKKVVTAIIRLFPFQ